MVFNFLDVILTLGVVQGFFLCVTIFFISSKNVSANKVLSLIVVICALVLVGKMVYMHFFSIALFKILSLTDNIIFLFGPLNYIYIRRLIVKSESPFNLPKFHYLPALIHFVCFFSLALFDEATYASILKSTIIFHFFNLIELTGLISGFFYLYRSYALLKKYQFEEKQNISYQQSIYKFLMFFLIAILISLIAWLFSYIDSYYLDRYFAYISYNAIWITIPVFIYIIGFYSLVQPEILRIPLDQVTNNIKRLTEEDIAHLKHRINHLLEEKIHLRRYLTLGDFANELNVSSNNLSWLLNNEYGDTFYDFINKHRIQEFLERINEGTHIKQTLSSIALDVGFNSKSTFNRVFKLHMNATPSDYIKSL